MSSLVMDEVKVSKSKWMNNEQKQSNSSNAALEELFTLLEEYGPSWYTEAHRQRIVAALLAH
jgi:hypothetical protein